MSFFDLLPKVAAVLATLGLRSVVTLDVSGAGDLRWQ